MSEPNDHIDRRLSVAPMMDWTDRHDRYFLRILSRRTLLYTEMITTGALIHGDAQRFLRYNSQEHPLALQLGGSDPKALAICAKMAENAGYDEVNLNCGCPSDRVQNGRFGACLMKEPDLVAEIVSAMRAKVKIPVTVKHRIGVDDQEDWEGLVRFVEKLAAAGCQHFIIHARKAWLQGLSPKENREVPPLQYPLVLALKKHRPELGISINGGITNLEQAQTFLDQGLDGVMIGRAAYQDPYILLEADHKIFGVPLLPLTRAQVVEAMVPYVEEQVANGVALKSITRHMLGLYNHQPGARLWRRFLSERATDRHAGAEVLIESLKIFSEHQTNAWAA